VSAVLAIALADFRDRVRRRSFLAVLSVTAFLGLQAIQGKIEVALGRFTGAPTSAWAGILMAVVGATFLGLAGFWVVKGSIERDGRTGVGQILAATPISRLAYTVGKALSHLGVLAAMCGVLVLAAVVLLVLSPAGEPIEPLEIVLPMVLLALPGLAFVAACAVLFETIRFLARGLGNLLWFFAWTLLLVATIETHGFDLFGIATARSLLGAKVRTLDPGWSGSFVIGANRTEDRATETFRWEELPVTGSLVAQRAAALGAALVVAMIAAWPFDRFDPARRRLRSARSEKRLDSIAVATSPAATSPPARQLPALAPERTRGSFRLGLAELRVALRSMSRWWWLGAAATTVGGLVGGDATRGGWLAAAFLWPALVWSGLATRDRACGIAPLLQAAPSPLARQLPALLLAGWLSALTCCGGAILGRLASGEIAGAVATTVGALAVPALAVALGLLSGGPRLFEGLYVALWYFGPLQRTAALDFTAASAESIGRAVPAVYLALAAMLLVAALALERRRAIDGEARFG